MNATKNRMAYRCLPLNIANTHCWEILNPVSFYAMWKGGDSQSDIVLYHDESDGPPLAQNTLGDGLLQFPIEGLLRTEPGFDLWVSGPVNRPKANIQATTGIVETDWTLQGFAVTWKFTKSNELVHFAKGEPFCSFFPIQRGLIETFVPRFREPHHDQAAWTRNRELREKLLRWNDNVRANGTGDGKKLWQLLYMRGPEKPVAPPHRMKLSLKSFDK